MQNQSNTHVLKQRILQAKVPNDGTTKAHEVNNALMCLMLLCSDSALSPTDEQAIQRANSTLAKWYVKI